MTGRVLVEAEQQYDDFRLKPVHIPMNWISLEPYYGTGAARWDLTHGIPEVTKDPMGFVHLRGLVRLTPSFPPNGNCVVLPSDFRPRFNGIYATSRAGAFNELRIHSSGAVIPIMGTPGSDTWVSLNGISFHTASQNY